MFSTDSPKAGFLKCDKSVSLFKFFFVSTGPKPVDLERTTSLKECLIPFGVFESEGELHHRMEVLGSLHKLARQWIRELSLKKNMPPSIAETVGGNIYTFGSYRLGVSCSMP